MRLSERIQCVRVSRAHIGWHQIDEAKETRKRKRRENKHGVRCVITFRCSFVWHGGSSGDTYGPPSSGKESFSFFRFECRGTKRWEMLLVMMAFKKFKCNAKKLRLRKISFDDDKLIIYFRLNRYPPEVFRASHGTLDTTKNAEPKEIHYSFRRWW